MLKGYNVLAFLVKGFAVIVVVISANLSMIDELVASGIISSEPLSKTTVVDMLRAFNRDEISRIHLEDQLQRWGIDFQLSKESVDELSEVLTGEKRQLIVNLMKNQIAPLTFNGQGIQILGGEQRYLRPRLPADNQFPESEPRYERLSAVYEDNEEPGFRLRSFEGDRLQMNFSLKNLSSIHRVCYKDVYLEILGGNRPSNVGGGDAEADQRRILTDLSLCPYARFYRTGLLHNTLVGS